ncbi:hypothetical protein EON66_12315 [archaeon]|nr:MAG: hypothetical protein EON66_12315 [archaeon]
MQTKSLSASLIGSASFVSKFSQSLAPMLAYTLLPNHTLPAAGADALSASRGAATAANTIWFMLLAIPLACVASQLTLWRFVYTLRSAGTQRAGILATPAADSVEYGP